MQPLPGFRDFLPNDCAARNYIFARWRDVARRYGFVEWDGPVLEPTDLYKKKSGDEIVGQLFNFTDKGEREVALRPELTPTLARVVAVHEREFKKPLKWFSIGSFFRYEKQQRGRLREHFQLNCDIVGEDSIDADAEIIALAIDLLRAFGFAADDFIVRVSDRDAWVRFLTGWRVPDTEIPNFLSIIDKLDRVGEKETMRRIKPFGVEWHDIKVMLESPQEEAREVSPRLDALFNRLEERELDRFVLLDCSLVRGLAYYTGTVFEIFDRGRKLRAIAGGGRYDNLIAQLSDYAVKMPALGFAMGDVVLGELINEAAAARDQMQKAIAAEHKIDVYIVIAKEQRRADALAQIQQLRDRGYRVDYPLTAEKVGKQFQTAEDLGASLVLLYGDEWPQVKVKNLATREESLIAHQALLDSVAKFFNVTASV
jgi:histidyl-tRNA synthetase